MGLTVQHVSTSPSAEWPRDLLDLSALRASGWEPRPFRQFILKLHARCNLACTYCYVYRSADQSWRERPVRMSEATATQAAARLGEHARAHGLSQVEVVFHGGEPLLVEPEFVAWLASTLRAATPGGTTVDLYVQTNGTRLHEPMLEVLRTHGVRVGVSLDGDPATHDAHRVHPNGRGSYAELAAGLALLRQPRYRHLFAGLLCVLDPASDPVAVYEHLVGFEPPAVDFLLPHAHWPPGRHPAGPPPPPGEGECERVDRVATPHGDWLVTAFDRWYDAPRRETVVRLFDEIIRCILGRPSRVESIGLSPAQVVVVETDGAIEQSDALKSAYEGAAFTGLHVADDGFDAALERPEVVARQLGLAALSEHCRRCELVSVCGGGFYPHRYRPDDGFRNPSFYCADLTKLIRHVVTRVDTDLAPLRVGPSTAIRVRQAE